MNTQAIWESSYGEPAIVIITLSIGYLCYLFISHSKFLHKSLLKIFGKTNITFPQIIIQRLTGVFFYGIIPLLLTIFILPASLKDYGLNSIHSVKSLYWILALSAFIIPFYLIGAKRTENLKSYPQIRVKEWNFNIFFLSTVSWIAYLFSYEFMLRGFLFFSFIRFAGEIPAVLINVFIYALVHIHKGINEILASFPFGIILCLMTLSTGSIWAAFVIHVILALSHEWISLHLNPEMNIKWKGKKK
ncbi:MAG: CPBP family intramembrane glutamic endopeptidase [Candidatus Aminicenantaceae bacterium]